MVLPACRRRAVALNRFPRRRAEVNLRDWLGCDGRRVSVPVDARPGGDKCTSPRRARRRDEDNKWPSGDRRAAHGDL